MFTIITICITLIYYDCKRKKSIKNIFFEIEYKLNIQIAANASSVILEGTSEHCVYYIVLRATLVPQKHAQIRVKRMAAFCFNFVSKVEQYQV